MLEYSCGTWLTGLGLQRAEPSAGGVSLWVTLLVSTGPHPFFHSGNSDVRHDSSSDKDLE